MKIFLTGVEGALGSEFIKHLDQYTVLSPKEAELDLTNFKKTVKTIRTFHPDLVCHLAAISDVDGCERKPAEAYRVNVMATYNVTTGANLVGAKILYVSTNYVFKGDQAELYYEWDKPDPINEYGRTKLLGEKAVKALTHRYFIVRTSWLFGKNSKTFASKLIENPKPPPEAKVIADQFGSFTYTKDLSASLALLIDTSYYGLYHLVNKGKASWFDFLKTAQQYLGLPMKIIPVNVADLNLSARRPMDAGLGSRFYEEIFDCTMRSWEDALHDFIKSLR